MYQRAKAGAAVRSFDDFCHQSINASLVQESFTAKELQLGFQSFRRRQKLFSKHELHTLRFFSAD